MARGTRDLQQLIITTATTSIRTRVTINNNDENSGDDNNDTNNHGIQSITTQNQNAESSCFNGAQGTSADKVGNRTAGACSMSAMAPRGRHDWALEFFQEMDSQAPV